MKWFELLFQETLQRSILVAMLILGILFLRKFIQNMPKKITYIVWILVFVRVLCPVTIPSQLSMSAVFTKNIQEEATLKNVSTYASDDLNSQEQTNKQIVISDSQTNMDNQKILPEENATTDQIGVGSLTADTPVFLSIFAILWGMGMVVLFIWNGRKIVDMKKILRIAVKKPTDLAYAVYESDQIPTPFVFGILRPRVYLPMNLSEEDISKILQHELVHIQRRDYLIKMVAYLAVILQWFNPLIWIAFAAFTKDMEMSCDEQVIAKQCGKERAEYSRTLLSMAMEQPSPTWSPIAFGNDHTKERIKHILSYERTYSRKRLIPAVAILLLLVACTGDPVNKTKEEQKENTSSTTEQSKIEEAVDNEESKDILEQAGYSSTCIKDLSASRTEYIGDNSKVGALVSLLPIYENVDRNEIALETKEEPYGVTIYYKQKEENDKAADLVPIYRNAVILMATIDNADWVSQICYWNNPALSSLYFQVRISREEVEKNFGITFSSYTKDEEGMTSLLMDLSSDTFSENVMEYIEKSKN